MNKREYDSTFYGASKKDKALDRAWQNRNFEIELYWKRASYFWTFIAATFVGYITLICSNNYKTNVKNEFPQIEYIILSLGFVFSVAWILVNKGSKHWQKNWENHIDLLENDITGPIYKVVYDEKSYSVTSINLLISKFVALIWFGLLCKYSFQNISFKNKPYYTFDLIWTITTVGIITVVILMIYFCGKTKTKDNIIKMRMRKSDIKDEECTTANSC